MSPNAARGLLMKPASTLTKAAVTHTGGMKPAGGVELVAEEIKAATTRALMQRPDETLVGVQAQTNQVALNRGMARTFGNPPASRPPCRISYSDSSPSYPWCR
jgi:hypothetical protein